MTKFYIPKTAVITMPTGERHVVVRGIGEVPDDLANSQLANKHGIKPTHEMTNKECDEMKVPRVLETVVPEPTAQQKVVFKS